MSTDPDDNDETTPKSKLGEKYAVYRDAEHYYWVVDTCAGGMWSPDVEDACWWDSPEEAIAALRAADMLEHDASPVVQGFYVLRVY